MKKQLAACLSLMALLGVVTGCRHKPVTAPPPPVPAPLPQPVAGLQDMPQLPPPILPAARLGLPAAPKKEAAIHRRYGRATPHRHEVESIPIEKSDQATLPGNGQEPSDSTPLGRFSTAPTSGGEHSYASIQNEIKAVQNGLHSIHRALSPSEQQTVNDIETFLLHASNALQAGDLDGAHTLTVKARVLLNEIQP